MHDVLLSHALKDNPYHDEKGRFTTHGHQDIVGVTAAQLQYVRYLRGIRNPGWSKRLSFERCGGDFEKLMELSILHPGDSDSVAATAGALYGLVYPVEELLPLFSRIEEQGALALGLRLAKYLEDFYGV